MKENEAIFATRYTIYTKGEEERKRKRGTAREKREVSSFVLFAPTQ